MEKRGICVYLRHYTIQELEREREVLNMTRSLLVEKIIQKYFDEKKKEKK